MAAPSKSELVAELEERLRFETLLTDISARFVSVPASRLDGEIEDAQRAICQCLGIVHSALWQISSEDADTFLLTHLFRSPDLPPAPDRAKASDFFPWCQRRVQANEIVSLPSTANLPPEAAKDQETWQYFGIKSTLILPLSAGGGPVFGVLSFDATQEERDWPEPLGKRLQLIAEVFANALDRKRAGQKLCESEARLALAADSANAALWTLAPGTGQIWGTEKTYELYGLSPDEGLDIDKFLAVVHPDDQEMVRRSILEAMQSGEESSAEYRIVRPDGSEGWIAVRGRRQPGNNGEPDRLMGAAIDITELKVLRLRLQAESNYLQEEIRVGGHFEDIVGESKAIKRVFQAVEQVAPTDSHVLITGETGTGKELVARAIHNRSRRQRRAMVKVDCASLPPSLIENELFGREKGAYTGALTQQTGRFELANGSTLFLDEVGELPLELQAKLLRVVQDGELERLGSPKTIKVDVRIIAATHRDIADEVKNGTFREDLFYRLNVFPIHVPPLRERASDIPLLVWNFVQEFDKKMGKKIGSVSQEDMQLLQRNSWPGNIRELRNAVERAVILSTEGRLNLNMPEAPSAIPPPTLKEAERQQILAALKKTDWRVKGPRGAAELLDMNPSTLFSTMRRLGIPTKSNKV